MKPRVIINCVANHYAGPGERIVEFSFPGTPGPAGGLIALRYREGGRPAMDLYRVEGVEVRGGAAPLWIVLYHHKHGTDAWPRVGQRPDEGAEIADLKATSTREGTDSLQIVGPFDLPKEAP